MQAAYTILVNKKAMIFSSHQQPKLLANYSYEISYSTQAKQGKEQ
jgi:hypothetical protein